MTDNFKAAVGNGAVIKVIGVGGGGGNAINSMISSGITGVEFIAANTDLQTLQSNLAPIKIQLGRELTKGLGAGANPEVGRNAALEDKAILEEVLSGADMIFVTAGMGGGTGTGAAPVIAQVARELGALTLGVVTKPFAFEGRKRKNQCDLGIGYLKGSVDALITIPNQRLLSIAPPQMTMLDSFKLADGVLVNAVRGISDIINTNGFINQDFADVKKIMSGTGMALMGIGTASGENRATDAARAAISSPLLEDVDIEGATGILINITASKAITLQEVSDACTLIQESAHEDAEVIFGAAVDESMGDTIRITVIATGFDNANVQLLAEPHFYREGYQGTHTQPQSGFVSYPSLNGSNQQNVNTHNQGNNPQSSGSHPSNSTYGMQNNSTPSNSSLHNRVGNMQASTQMQGAHNGYQGYSSGASNVPRGTSYGAGPNAGQGANSVAGALNSQSSTNSVRRTANTSSTHTPTLSNLAPQTGQLTRPFSDRATNQPTTENGHNNSSISNSSAETETTFRGEPQNAQNTPKSDDPFANKEMLNRIRSEAEQLTKWTLRQDFEPNSNETRFDSELAIGEESTKPELNDRNNSSDSALSLAEELSQVEIDETDYETPAFLRKRDETSRSTY